MWTTFIFSNSFNYAISKIALSKKVTKCVGISRVLKNMKTESRNQKYTLKIWKENRKQRFPTKL